MMSSVTYVLSIIVMLSVAAVLVRGLVNMARGGSGNLSNKLMQARRPLTTPPWMGRIP